MKDRVVIFGAGRYGRLALSKYQSQIEFWIDNNPKLQGKMVAGRQVKSVEQFLNEEPKYHVIIASKTGLDEMKKQLDRAGFDDYEVYCKDQRSYFESDDVVFDIYEDNPLRNLSEDQFNCNIKDKYIISIVNDRVEKLAKEQKLFCQVEIETINRCNGECDFCPVNRHNDSRQYKRMDRELFEKIINELEDLGYDGKLSLFSNNEPFLDKDIVDKYRYAKQRVPNAKLQLYTNGTLLNIHLFKQIVKYADEIVVDNYSENGELIEPAKEILSYCQSHPEIKKKVTIALRNPHEILSSRGGDAPNRKKKLSFKEDKCNLPFEEMIIRPDGKLSLCCCDPLGKITLGDLTKESMVDAWYGEKYKAVREKLLCGRGNLEHCMYCDHFGIL